MFLACLNFVNDGHFMMIFLFYFSGVFPDIFNLASEADILVNATCGEYGPETFCKLVEHVRRDPMNYLQCGVCNANGDEYERHPINLAIDGSNRWWQSPSLANGWRYNYVTITLDLGQVRVKKNFFSKVNVF